jgi:hypothetical protein
MISRKALQLLVVPTLWLGCDAVIGLDPGEPLCTTAAECVDDNPCTIDECSENVRCENTNASDGASSEPIDGNCQNERCMSGQLVMAVNNQDLPDDDEPCTVDTCEAGMVTHTSLPDNVDCTSPAVPTGLCAAGVCTPKCAGDVDCAVDDPCIEPRCDLATGLCYSTVLDHQAAPGVAQVPGDCREQQCINGHTIEVVDDADVPATPENECDVELCNSGAASNAPGPVGLGCVMADAELGVCNELGACVQCLERAHCDQVDLPCVRWTCTDYLCVPENKPRGFEPPITPQLPADCRITACDGAGSLMGMDDLTDNDDLNPCTADSCSAGSPASAINNPEPAATTCGPAGLCNGSGLCGSCTADADCPAGSCRTPTCDLISGACGFDPGPLIGPQVVGDCAMRACDLAGREVSNILDTDVPVGPCMGCSDGEPIVRAGDPCTLPGNQPGLCAHDATCVQCLRDADCPDATLCNQAKCDPEFNVCYEVAAPMGTIAPALLQDPGDCLVVVCDGTGQGVQQQALPADVPPFNPATPCVSQTCSVGGEVVDEYFPVGQPCGGAGVCDGLGSCR